MERKWVNKDIENLYDKLPKEDFLDALDETFSAAITLFIEGTINVASEEMNDLKENLLKKFIEDVISDLKKEK